MRKLYGFHVNPLVRVIHGLPISWDPSIASAQFSDRVSVAVWSTCSRFIAIGVNGSSGMVVLDGVTLKLLHTMHNPNSEGMYWDGAVFSPDSCLLTSHAWVEECILSWDIQTGGLISDISTQGLRECKSMSYSGCGTMVGCLFTQKIVIYNVISGTHISSHLVQQSDIEFIWTLGEFLQFAIIESSSIIIYELSFNLGHSPTRVRSLSIPDNFSTEGLVLLPTLSRLAFLQIERILVWDAQHQTILLDSVDIEEPARIFFSPDGHFLLCGTQGLEFYCWKETPEGYILHQKLTSGAEDPSFVISPDGQSMISFCGKRLQLWPTIKVDTSPPGISTQVFKDTEISLLEYSPDESLVAFACRLSNTVTVLNVESGNPQFVIDTGTEVCGLRLTEDTVVVVGDKMITTWSLLAGDSIFGAERNIDDNIQSTTFKHSVPIERIYACISPDLCYIAFGDSGNGDLHICSMDGGNELVVSGSTGFWAGFSSDGSEVWCSKGSGGANQWRIIKGDESGGIELEPLVKHKKLPDGFPYEPSHGYKVTNDQWILDLSGRQLMKLPYYLQGSRGFWNGKFLRVVNTSSQELVILKLEV